MKKKRFTIKQLLDLNVLGRKEGSYDTQPCFGRL